MARPLITSTTQVVYGATEPLRPAQARENLRLRYSETAQKSEAAVVAHSGECLEMTNTAERAVPAPRSAALYPVWPDKSGSQTPVSLGYLAFSLLYIIVQTLPHVYACLLFLRINKRHKSHWPLANGEVAA
ncbi:hypothetical protein V8F20_010337 [Naviculisporaceae sp. PSN 640]